MSKRPGGRAKQARLERIAARERAAKAQQPVPTPKQLADAPPSDSASVGTLER